MYIPTMLRNSGIRDGIISSMLLSDISYLVVIPFTGTLFPHNSSFHQCPISKILPDKKCWNSSKKSVKIISLKKYILNMLVKSLSIRNMTQLRMYTITNMKLPYHLNLLKSKVEFLVIRVFKR